MPLVEFIQVFPEDPTDANTVLVSARNRLCEQTKMFGLVAIPEEEYDQMRREIALLRQRTIKK